MNVITIVIIVTIIHTTPLSFATPSSCVSPSPSYISLHFSSPSYLSEVSEEQGLRGCFQQVPALSPEASSPPDIQRKLFLYSEMFDEFVLPPSLVICVTSITNSVADTKLLRNGELDAISSSGLNVSSKKKNYKKILKFYIL